MTSDLRPQTDAAERPRRRIVAIPDYLQPNGVVSSRRSMTEALLEAGLLPVVLPEMDDEAADQFLSHCDAVMIGGGIKDQQYDRRCAFEDRVISLAVERGLTIVGICHGCQVINRHFGETPAPGFRVTAVSEEDGVIEAIEHESLPIAGFQFHPEIYWKKDPRFRELIRRAFATRQ